jgi:predicted nucleotidyltransferase
MAEQEATGRLATVRLVAGSPRDEAVVLDLLFASSGIEAEVVDSADVMDLFDRLAAPIASVSSLIALKVLARDDAERPQDRVDLVALLHVVSRSDVLEARRLLSLIQDRGYARGRDLLTLLDVLLADLGV